MIALLAIFAFVAVAARVAYAKPGCHSRACSTRVWHHHQRLIVRANAGWLARVRRCESGGNYRTNTGNGFYGAYQFDISSWRGAGGVGMPNTASRLEQDYRALVWRQRAGVGAWPVCG